MKGQNSLFYSNNFHELTKTLLWDIARLPMSHRSISYGGMADTGTTRSG